MNHITLSLLLLCSASAYGSVTDWLRNDVVTFVKGSYNNFAAVGTCFAVSKYVAQDMNKELSRIQEENQLEHVEFLEIGAGTGILSGVFEEQLESMVENGTIKSYTLTLIELEPVYVETLNKRFGENPNVAVVGQDVLEWETESEFDFVVSTLPWNSKFFTDKTVDTIQTQVNEILAPHGVYSFVEYSLFGKLSRLLRSGNQTENFSKKRQVVEEMVAEQGYQHKLIWRNIPVPIHTYYLNKK